jgi:hypothetical protein
MFIKTMKSYVFSFKYFRDFSEVTAVSMSGRVPFIREVDSVTGLCSLKLRSLNLLYPVDLNCIVLRICIMALIRFV